MTDEQSFLKAICDRPDDDTARLVYADWLAEHGDPDRGEFIRIDIRLAHRDPDDEAEEARRPGLFARRDELLKRHRQRWLEPFLPHARETVFERGFVQELSIPAYAFLDHGERWMALTPLTRVRFTTCQMWDVSIHGYVWRTYQLVQSPLLSGLEKIDLEGRANGLDEIDATVLAGHPDLSRLRELVLDWNELGPAGAAALAASPQLAGLEFLHLTNNGIGDAGARALVESPHLGRLKGLWVDKNNIRKRTWALLEDRFGPALMG